MLSNGSLGAKIGAKCVQMEAWRVPNGGSMSQDGGQEGAKCYPQGLTEALAPSRCQEASQRPQDRLVYVFASNFGVPKAPREPKSYQKADQK